MCQQISSPTMINNNDDNDDDDNNNNNNNTKSLSCLIAIHLKSTMTVIYSNIKLRVKSLP